MNEWLSGLQKLWPDLSSYIVYGAIAVVTLIGVFKCLIPLISGTRALRRAISRLQKDVDTTAERPIWQENKFMGRRLRGCWSRFLQNAEQLDHRGLPCNVEDYINDDTVTHGPGNATLAELIPSLLTSLGILGTFMGMTSGLSGLDVSSTETMMAGIQNLLQGMQYAFGTSVAGVACSIVFNMLNRILQGSSYRAVDDFVESFTQLAMQRPLDNDVQLICQNQDRNHLLGTVTDTISTQLAASIESAVGRAMQPVSRSLDNFLIGATRQQVEGVGRIVGQFVDRMNDTLSGQFLNLGQVLTQVNQHQQITLARLDQSLNAAGGIVQEANRLHGISQDILDRFGGYIAELSEARRLDTAFDAKAAQVLETMQHSAEEQAKNLEALRFGEKTLAASVTGAAKALEDMHQQSDETLARGVEHFVNQVSGGLDKSLSEFRSGMNELVSLLGDKISRLETSGADAAELGEIQRLLTSISESLQAGQTVVDK